MGELYDLLISQKYYKKLKLKKKTFSMNSTVYKIKTKLNIFVFFHSDT